jgi:hypothetical protein
MNHDHISQDAQRIEDERLRVQEEEERLRREEEELLTQQGDAARGQGPHRRGAGKGGKDAGAAEAIPGGPMAQRARFAFSAAGKGFASPSRPAASGARLSGSGSSSGGSGKAVGVGLLVLIVAAAAIYVGTSGKVDPKQVTQVAAQWLNGSPDRGAAEPPDEAPRANDGVPDPVSPGSDAHAQAKLPSVEPTVATPTPDGSVDTNGAAALDAPAELSREPEEGQEDRATAQAETTPAASDSSHGLTPIAMRDAVGSESTAKLEAIEARLDLLQAQVSRLASSVNSPGSAQHQQGTRRARPSTLAAGSRTSSRELAAAAKPTPATEARSRAGQLLAVDVWGGVPSVVVGTGDFADRRTRVLRPGDSHNGVSLLHADPVTGQATFSVAGTTFTMNVKEGG